MPDPARYGHATCHPEKFAMNRGGLCSACYQRARKQRLAEEAGQSMPGLREMAQELGVELLAAEPDPDQDLPVRSGIPLSLAQAIRLTDEQLIAALPEAAVVLRRQLQTKAGLKAAELLLRSYVVPTADGPRRFFSVPHGNEKAATGTQVVIGLSLAPAADGALQVGKVVGQVAPTAVAQKAQPVRK